ncbi:hypothetical protein [Hyperthermus butylicus]|uniref:hypothetical protein n=1 Tax=Hyperthermus butylicus TaxID=54248 RepID=UPI00129A29A5|nr:hypothetical protein [Hyperthermus butylicus]
MEVGFDASESANVGYWFDPDQIRGASWRDREDCEGQDPVNYMGRVQTLVPHNPRHGGLPLLRGPVSGVPRSTGASQQGELPGCFREVRP